MPPSSQHSPFPVGNKVHTRLCTNCFMCVCVHEHMRAHVCKCVYVYYACVHAHSCVHACVCVRAATINRFIDLS